MSGIELQSVCSSCAYLLSPYAWLFGADKLCKTAWRSLSAFCQHTEQHTDALLLPGYCLFERLYTQWPTYQCPATAWLLCAGAEGSAVPPGRPRPPPGADKQQHRPHAPGTALTPGHELRCLRMPMVSRGSVPCIGLHLCCLPSCSSAIPCLRHNSLCTARPLCPSHNPSRPNTPSLHSPLPHILHRTLSAARPCAPQVPASINRFLREYQRDGVRFLFRQYSRDKGGILADDMGLGKTVQVKGSAGGGHCEAEGRWSESVCVASSAGVGRAAGGGYWAGLAVGAGGCVWLALLRGESWSRTSGRVGVELKG